MSVEQMMGARRAPAEVTGRVTAGIDWASEEHAVAVVDDQGRPLDRFSVAHTAPGSAPAGRTSAPLGGSARSRSNVPTGRWSTHCSRPS